MSRFAVNWGSLYGDCHSFVTRPATHFQPPIIRTRRSTSSPKNAIGPRLEVHMRICLSNDRTGFIRFIFLAAVVVTSGSATQWVKAPSADQIQVCTAPSPGKSAPATKTVSTYQFLRDSLISAFKAGHWGSRRTNAPADSRAPGAGTSAAG